jgi:hypothetical protein
MLTVAPEYESTREAAGAMGDGQTGSLEGALSRAEAGAEAAIKAAANVTSALRRYRKAAQQGQLRDLRAATEAARRTLQTLDQEVANVAESWEFDEEAYLQGEGFVAELIAAGERADLRISYQDNRLYAYPALIRVLPGDRAVLIDKARERRLRPSVLAGLLRDRQRRPPRFKAADFLEALHDVYQVAIRQHGTRLMEGAPVPLLDLYEMFTLLPGARREYSAQEFARDVYLLDQSGETTTKTGERVEFHASTGTKLRRGTLTMVTQEGREKRYYAISFAPAARD